MADRYDADIRGVVSTTVYKNAGFNGPVWDGHGSMYEASFQSCQIKGENNQWADIDASFKIWTPLYSNDEQHFNGGEKTVYLGNNGEIFIQDQSGSPHFSTFKDLDKAKWWGKQLHDLRDQLTLKKIDKKQFTQGIETLWTEVQTEAKGKAHEISAIIGQDLAANSFGREHLGGLMAANTPPGAQNTKSGPIVG